MTIKKLNESKTKLEPAYITSLTGEGWNMVGNLKIQKDDFKHNYKNADKVVAAIEELEEAYLIYLGQLEAVLAENGIEPISKEEKEEDKDTLKEELETLVLNEPIINVNLNVAPEDEKFEDECEPCEEKETPGTHCGDAFEFYCDFDDPVGPSPALETPWQGIIK